VIVLMANSAAKLDRLKGIGVVKALEASNHFWILTHDPEVTRKAAGTQSGAQIKEDTESGDSGETKL
jgi:hypothetical protein